MFKSFVSFAALALPFALLAACDEGPGAPPAKSAVSGSAIPSALPDSLFVSAEIPGAKPIPAVKKTAKVGDTVIIRGRVGGDVAPFIDGAAVMKLVDVDMIITCPPTDPCKTKWDYCCAAPEDLNPQLASIELVDKAGKTVPVSFKDSHGITYFSLLTIKGKVASLEGGSLTIHPEAIFSAGVDDDGKKAGTPVMKK